MGHQDFDVVVIGGGPSGSTTALVAARAGLSVCLVEKHAFPRETLCGEFLSGEVVSILTYLGLKAKFLSLGPSPIARVAFCTDDGSLTTRPLQFTAYGMKRGRFDLMLLEGAIAHGVTVLQPAEVETIQPEGERVIVRCRFASQSVEIRTRCAVGAYGRSSRLDKLLGRDFAGKQTGLNGVKFHLPVNSLASLGADEILLCGGRGMYCGINHVGSGEVTVCFLERRTMRDDPPRARIRNLTEANPGFSRFVTEETLHALDNAKILGSGNIFFGPRRVVERGVFMVGDAAGVVAPLAGDGIGMALQGGMLLGRIIAGQRSAREGQVAAGNRYQREWEQLFRTRMAAASLLQHVLLSSIGQRTASALLRSCPSLLDVAIRWTRDDMSS